MDKIQYELHILSLLTKLERQEDYEGIKEAILEHKKYKLDKSYNCGCMEIECPKNYLGR